MKQDSLPDFYSTQSPQTELTEKETRELIDKQLRQVGWEADTKVLRYSNGTRPAKGRNIAIAEWPVDSDVVDGGAADYALFIGEKLVGFIEAKKWGKDVASEIDFQGKEYARCVRPCDYSLCLGEWGEYHVPFIFTTNGRDYSEQVKTKSGIWWLDLRKKSNISSALLGWMSPDGLSEKLKEDIEGKNERLKELPYDFLRDPSGLGLRYYQLNAIQAAEKAITEGKKSALLAMATGTGKTRTVLGMIYRFLKTERFRRILFLVDRTELGTQALDVFKEVKLEELMTLDEIYDVKGLEDTTVEKETKIHVSTVQGLVKRILYCGDNDTRPAVSDYDLIIIDEAHRGYIFDKEMSDAEILFRDQRDYQSKYRYVVDYFDAVKIALTATPALHTTQIFGEPVYTYTYPEAVLDGYLVDHDAPHLISTELSREGIHFKKGETVTGYYPRTNVHSWELEDEMDFAVEQFNRRVITEAFNREVLKEVAHHIDPEASKTQGKTLIYAVNDQHADLIVKILREIYAETGVSNDAILKITGSVANGNKDRIKKAIRRFKNEEYPSIVVTVDLLTTGVDVPSITNLVFIRRVKSRILFEQMKGRATRLCPEIHKDHFDIYDCVGVCEALRDVDTMQPIGVNPYVTFVQLVDGLHKLKEEEHIEAQVEQIIAKLRRKVQRIQKEEEASFNKHFADHAEGLTPQQFMEHIKDLLIHVAKAELIEHRPLFAWLDNVKLKGDPVLISNKPDGGVQHTRGFGNGADTPEDYLEAFTRYISENRDEIAALSLVCTKPSDLTRDSLKSLERALARAGYTEQHLNTALSQMSNAEITADIISIIRKQALGTPLLNHEDRIRQAVNALRKAHNFSKTELNWLVRIEKYLLKETVLTVDSFNEAIQFKEKGGFASVNKAFGNQLHELIKELNHYLYNFDTTQSA